MPISDELLLQLPITHDDNTRALNELVRERVLANRRRDEDSREAAAKQKLTDILAEESAKSPGRKAGKEK